MASNAPVDAQHPLVVVMGVSGSGKSTVGAQVADEFGVPFVDGDSLHPEVNVQKMAAGHPLDDADRWPWLKAIGAAMADARDTGLVVACSALKRSYRDAIREKAPAALFLLLDGTREVLNARMQARVGHFMPASLLDSQLATLERLGSDELGVVVDVDASVPDVVATAVSDIRDLMPDPEERRRQH
ncbi:gluconokinase [Microbacterium sp. STN6]|uniref:gluconokinase n=1 Tax=Microbacterium sp. STN6 TaxID=2995588 RepID=UPI002260AB9C|nr:gluconokinase [Microbacterium sp. STN6]MCX7521818.1 gluconokinase [Microbacterium sp. STN6]